MYWRERAASMYDPWAYGLATSLVELPWQLAQSVLFTCILYPLMAYERTASSFFYYLGMTFLNLVFYVAFGQALMLLSPNEALALIFALGANFTWGL